MSVVQGLPPTYTESKLLNKGGNGTPTEVHRWGLKEEYSTIVDLMFTWILNYFKIWFIDLQTASFNIDEKLLKKKIENVK